MANPSGQCIEEGNKINGLLKERASAENAASRKPQRNLINSGQLTNANDSRGSSKTSKDVR